MISYWLVLVMDLNRLAHWDRDKMDAISLTTFLNENDWIPIKISLKFVPKGPINTIPALCQILATNNYLNQW